MAPYTFGKLYRLQALSLEGNPLLAAGEDLRRALDDLQVSALVSLNLAWMNLSDVQPLFQVIPIIPGRRAFKVFPYTSHTT